ncbi:hypothetical protein ACOBR2_04985 [Telmatobacter bradus]|uniref:hypothetical protein n=1 Tax=Telmatobacter bradus TaxID=474953 RepID=UPI003B42CFDA
MKNRVLQKICCGAGFALVLSLPVLAQQRGPGGPQGGGGHMPSMPSPMGGGATANTSTSATSSDTHRGAQASNAASQNAGAGVQFGPVGRWWDDRSVVSAVGLSSDQKRHMDAIFAQNRSAIVSSYQNLLKEQAKLSALNKNPLADQTSTFAAIDAVNQARASLQKTVAQVYMQIKQQMSSDQIEKLTKLQ